MSTSTPPSRPDQVFGERAGQAWVLLQEQTDAQIDPFGQMAIAPLALSAGERVLDVGCGCGQTLRQLAERVGPAGRVLGMDISAPMLARAKQRVAVDPTIALVRADAQRPPLASGAFDALFSRFGVMFFADAPLAFANLRRALRPGGRLAFVCWQALARNPWAALPLQAVVPVLGGGAPALVNPECPGPFFLSDPDRTRAILVDAGFSDVTLAPHERPLHLGGARTLAQAVTYCQQIGPAARAMADAPETLRSALDSALAGALAPFVSEKGVWLDAAVFIVTARA